MTVSGIQPNLAHIRAQVDTPDPDASDTTTPTTTVPAEPAQPAEPTDPVDTTPAEDTFATWLGRSYDKGESAALTAGTIFGGSAASVAGFRSLLETQPLRENMTTMSRVGTAAATALPKIGPAIIFGIAGPAIADGVSIVAPNIVKPVKDDMKPKEKSGVQVQRAASAGVVTTGAAGGVFLKWPQAFKAKVLGQDLFLGASKVDDAGLMLKNSMKLTPATLRATAGVIGLGAAAGVAAKATWGDAEEAIDTYKTAGLIAAGTGAAVMLLPLVTKGRTQSIVGMLPDTLGIKLPRPSPELVAKVKSFVKVAAPVSVVPAVDSAYRHFDVEDAFGNLVEGDKKKPTTKK